MAAQPAFTDVRDNSMRSIVESLLSGPTGRLIIDAVPGGRFYPNNNVTKFVAAIAFVRAAGLEAATSTAALPPTVADSLTIPSQYRGHVAIALQQGFLTLDGNRFNPNRSITRIELAKSTHALITR
jgi:hypothetical protein